MFASSLDVSDSPSNKLLKLLYHILSSKSTLFYIVAYIIQRLKTQNKAAYNLRKKNNQRQNFLCWFYKLTEKQVKSMPTFLVGWAAARAESGAGSLTSKRIMDTFIQTLSQHVRGNHPYFQPDGRFPNMLNHRRKMVAHEVLKLSSPSTVTVLNEERISPKRHGIFSLTKFCSLLGRFQKISVQQSSYKSLKIFIFCPFQVVQKSNLYSRMETEIW